MKLAQLALAVSVSISPLIAVNVAASSFETPVAKALPQLEKLYLYLHQNPELSYQEKNSSERMAKELAKLGFKVTKNFGGYGVVGIFENGAGPTIMIRADTDGLPIIEQTGKPHQASISRIQQLQAIKNEILQEDKDEDESLYNLKAYVEIETLIHA